MGNRKYRVFLAVQVLSYVRPRDYKVPTSLRVPSTYRPQIGVKKEGKKETLTVKAS